ncbi:hypothetical protein [Barnesiella sp. An55]|uniref:tetratricopeptide repeat protein n=1 Tax=Barnesiella sp. An55 TaxID=1965646 RepID=UPI000B3774DE|nr:hypothetical protein [Barnesiella sp. An55]OUN73919.1 hypothetical protein B5G10_02515 [Barnesiella sp. An55]HIZ26948.1 hypothetical protein [Candidatus Barnesiella merdipullorum]
MLYRQGVKMEEQHIPDSALILYHQALKQLSGTQNQELKGKIYNHLGDLLLDYNIYETAQESYSQAIQASQSLADKSNLSQAYRGMGKYYYLYKDRDSALYYFEKPLGFFDQIANREERSSVYNNLTTAYKQRNNIEKALEYNAKALSLTRSEVKRLRNYAVRGQLFALQQQYDSALFYLEQASQSKDKSIRASAYFKLADLPEEAGINDSLRFFYLHEGYRLSDSIENSAVSHQIDRQEHIRITTDLKQQSHTRLIVSIAVCIAAVLLLSIATFTFYRRHLKRRNEKLFAHKWEKQEARAQENENRELQIIDIIRKAGEQCSRDFKATNTYAEWHKRITSGKESLSYDEQKSFQTVVLKMFDPYLQQLSNVVPLTGNDAFLCALIQLGFSTRECAACRGISSETIRSQRTRIRKKIPQNFSDQGLGMVILGEENLSKR